MNQVVSFFTALIFAVLNLLNISFPSEDLLPLGKTEVKASQEQIELLTEIYETETEWIASLQLENGAIPMTYSQNGSLRMSPYFADFAALALLDNAEKYSSQVKMYMDWHFSHLNTAEEDVNGLDGTIYDYTIIVENGAVSEEFITEADGVKTYDSTDSYAATFLTVLCKYYEKTGDGEYIIAHSEEIRRITDVMLATMHEGLTFARPDHRVKYLMDNCEVYEGFVAAAALFENVIVPVDESYSDFAAECSEAALLIKNNVNEKMWNSVGKYYTPEMTYLGIPTKIFTWSRYYPCATSQLFPIISGIIEPDTERARALYESFCESYNWQSFDYPDDFYWGSNVYAAAVMNDLDSVMAYMENYETLLEKHAYPLYNADSAKTAMAAYIMLTSQGAI